MFNLKVHDPSRNLLLILSLLSFVSFSQTNTSEFRYKYRIQFKDKNKSIYSLNNPSEYLSNKAIEKRKLYNIPIDLSDFPVNQTYVDSIKQTGVRILNKSKWFNYVTIDTVNTDSFTLNKIKSFSFVSKVETVARISKFKKSKISVLLPEKKINLELINLYASYDNNPKQIIHSWSSEYNDIYKYGYSYEQVNMILCDSIHRMGFRGKGMTIAVLDGGFIGVDSLTVFDSLRLNHRIKGTKDFVKPGGNVYTAATHGMNVLSIIAGNIPGQYLGTAPDADFWLLRTEDVNSENIIEEDNWVSAAEFADSLGVDVINSSLGYTRFDDSSENHTFKDLNGKFAKASKAAAIAARKGIIIVNSAGNEGADKSWGLISVPADADSILSVGAVDIHRKYAGFSSRGPTNDGRVKPDVVALGLGAALASPAGGIVSGNGTSFSSPLIAGMAACLWQSKKELSNLKIIEAIKKTSNHYKHPDFYTGYGIPNAATAYWFLSGKDMNQIESFNYVYVYPNPFINEINILIVSSDTYTFKIELYDETGKKVYSRDNLLKNYDGSYVGLIDVGHVTSGIYFMKIISKDKIINRKLIKIK